MKVLVIDVGGNNVKLRLTGREDDVVKIPSGKSLTAKKMVEQVLKATADWDYDHVTVGVPGPVKKGKLVLEPVNLGDGWVDFDLQDAFGKPTKVINDAALQALGSYEGGRMLFLGLGTGLGNTLIDDWHVIDMEMGHLPYRDDMTFEEWVGSNGLDELGKKQWREVVVDVVELLRLATNADYVVLGGGNVKKLKELPPHCRRGDNSNVYKGGLRAWEH